MVRRSLLIVALIGAATATAVAPTSAGDGGQSLRVEAANTNYVNVDGFANGVEITITFDTGSDPTCPDFILLGQGGGGDPLDNHSACDIEPGWVVSASLDGGASSVAELVVADALITGFSGPSVLARTTDPDPGDPTDVEYSCGGGVFVHAPNGARRFIDSPGPVALDFRAGKGNCVGAGDTGSFDVTAGAEFVLIMQVNDGEADADSTVDVRTYNPPPPPNNHFHKAEPFTQVKQKLEVNTLGATTQSSEPAPCGDIGSTVWYSFEPGATMRLVLNTFGSDYNTVLAAYAGESLGSLTNVDCHDHAKRDWSRIEFVAQKGETYWIQAGGSNGAQGNLMVKIKTTTKFFCLGGRVNILGTAGNDALSGGPGFDRIRGFGGDDELFGRKGNDKLCGDAGDDFLDGGPDKDALDGGVNTDTCDGGNGAPDTAVRCETTTGVP